MWALRSTCRRPEANLIGSVCLPEQDVSHGFEWPRKELDKFERMRKASKWPQGWFTKAESGEQPWMFYMSPGFVEHCLEVIEQITSGIEEFDLERTSRE